MKAVQEELQEGLQEGFNLQDIYLPAASMGSIE